MGPIEKALRGIEAEATKYREGKPSHLLSRDGICKNLEGVGVPWFHRNCQTWPKFSGSTNYPVPSFGGRPQPKLRTAVNAANAYHRAQSENRLWVGRYGGLRMELLRWMIEEAETQGV